MDFQLALCITALATLLLVLVEGQQQPQQPQIVPSQQANQGVHQMNQRGGFRNKQHVHDKEHLKHHYDGFIDFDHLDYDQMRDEEIAFHYFKIHDTDDNNRLDGLEIMQAMMHNKDFKKLLDGEGEEEEDDEEDEDDEDEDQQRLERMKEEQSWQQPGHNDVMDEETILTIVNQVLDDDDVNNDGYIDFPEFIKSQKDES